MRSDHKGVLVLLGASYVALVGGLIGQFLWGGSIIQPAVSIFAWLRLCAEAVRFQVAKREGLTKLRMLRVGIGMWLIIAIFVTLALNTTLIVGEG